jgi:hypothetical protein
MRPLAIFLGGPQHQGLLKFVLRVEQDLFGTFVFHNIFKHTDVQLNFSAEILCEKRNTALRLGLLNPT